VVKPFPDTRYRIFEKTMKALFSQDICESFRQKMTGPKIREREREREREND
jgi:hypothetical protein